MRAACGFEVSIFACIYHASALIYGASATLLPTGWAPGLSARVGEVNAGRGHGPGGQAGGADRPAAVFAGAVAALGKPEQRRVDLGEVLPGLGEQGSGVLALEGDRGALRVVLVVGAGRRR